MCSDRKKNSKIFYKLLEMPYYQEMALQSLVKLSSFLYQCSSWEIFHHILVLFFYLLTVDT